MIKRLSGILLLAAAAAAAAFGQTSSIVRTDLPQAEIDRIIKQFTRNEALFRQALNLYVFNRNATIQTIGLGGQITGTYKRDSFMTFSEAGERFERVLFAPVSTLKEVSVT
jgi:hypothetical protein